jgi:hypothetical protein
LASAHNPGGWENFFFTYDYGSFVNVVTTDGDEHFLRVENRSADDLRNLLQLGRFQEAPDRRANWPNIAALLVWLLSAGTLLVGAVAHRTRCFQ